MRRNTRDALMLAAFLAASLGSGLLSQWLSGGTPGEWYHNLNKPAFIPPPWIFPVVWSVLYIFMGVAAWLVWRQRLAGGVRWALIAFFVQLLLNFVWSPIFFGLHNLPLATLDVLLLLAAILATCRLFFEISGLAGWLMLPYFCWTGFAAAITFFVWRMNG